MPVVMNSDYLDQHDTYFQSGMMANGFDGFENPYRRDTAFRDEMHRGGGPRPDSDEMHRGGGPRPDSSEMYRGGGPRSESGEMYRGGDPRTRSGAQDEVYSKVIRSNGFAGQQPSQNDRFNWTDPMAGDRNGLDGRPDIYKGNEPVFEVDHLATFTATKRGTAGLISLEEGLNKLQNMEVMTGIWTMRCLMIIDRLFIIILDNQTGEEHDRFPIQLVHRPTAIVRNDPRETYNNLILFTVVTDPKKGDPEPNMHIFQSVSKSAQDIADEVQAAKEGRPRLSNVQGCTMIPPPPPRAAPEPPSGPAHVREQVTNFQKIIETAQAESRPVPGMYGRNRPSVNRHDRDDADSLQGERIEADMQKLNACCDDIEKFVSRLQQAAEAYKELEKRSSNHGKGKKKQVGDGMLNMRAKPPNAEDFIDIFQKFKYAFNILARLKPYIHDPNAPELVHFLFTPLSLIYEASRDPSNISVNIVQEAVYPLLTKDAKELLLNCLTSKEQEFWMSLGEVWFITRDQWRESITPYIPRFFNGWQPSPSDLDEDHPPANSSKSMVPITMSKHRDDLDYRISGPQPSLPYDDRYRNYDRRTEEASIHYMPPRSLTPPGNPYPSHSKDRVSIPAQNSRPIGDMSRPETNATFARELKSRGVKLARVEHARQGKNAKELTVEGGDILEIIECSRNWWKLRNCYGEVGHAPYTILRDISDEMDDELAMAFNPMISHPRTGFHSIETPRQLPDLPLDTSSHHGRPANDWMYKLHHLPQPDDYLSRVDSMNAQINRLAISSHSDGQQLWHDADRDSVARQETTIPSPYNSRSTSPVHGGRLQGQSSLHPASPARQPSPIFHIAKTYQPKKQHGSDQSLSTMSVEEANLHVELKNRMDNTSSSSVIGAKGWGSHGPSVYVSESSPPEEIAEWLRSKGFTQRTLQIFGKYNGRELFHVKRTDIDRMLPNDEAARLKSQLTVQKNISGYATHSEAELQAILQRRKVFSDTRNSGDESNPDFGRQQNFHQVTPQTRSTSASEADSDEFAGDILKDQLVKQRQRMLRNT